MKALEIFQDISFKSNSPVLRVSQHGNQAGYIAAGERRQKRLLNQEEKGKKKINVWLPI